MAQWRNAASELEEQRVSELQAMTGESAQAATLALLELGASLPTDPRRWNHSGLVEQQALFHRRPGDVEPDRPGRR